DVGCLVEQMLGATPLVRIGRAPKRLLVYRAAQPLLKLATPPLFLPDSTKVQVEILGLGQQFVADGTHPTPAGRMAGSTARRKIPRSLIWPSSMRACSANYSTRSSACSATPVPSRRRRGHQLDRLGKQPATGAATSSTTSTPPRSPTSNDGCGRYFQ